MLDDGSNQPAAQTRSAVRCVHNEIDDDCLEPEVRQDPDESHQAVVGRDGPDGRLRGAEHRCDVARVSVAGPPRLRVEPHHLVDAALADR
nr:hypothetical protein [Actinotalea solisilvae]